VGNREVIHKSTGTHASQARNHPQIVLKSHNYKPHSTYGLGERHTERAVSPAAQRHGAIVTAVFGSAPNISGAYRASTRVSGSWNSPVLLSLSVYSTVHFPFGTYS
jgi:hypothetical protein